jgi:hypothetical protein
MIDPRTDAQGAIEEISYLAERMDTPSLREAINGLLLLALKRSFVKVRAGHAQNTMTPRRESQFVEDFLFNVAGSFRDAITTDTLVSGGPSIGRRAPIPAMEN